MAFMSAMGLGQLFYILSGLGKGDKDPNGRSENRGIQYYSPEGPGTQ